MVWIIGAVGYLVAALLLSRILRGSFHNSTLDWTLCGDCERYSPQEYCPYC